MPFATRVESAAAIKEFLVESTPSGAEVSGSALPRHNVALTQAIKGVNGRIPADTLIDADLGRLPTDGGGVWGSIVLMTARGESFSRQLFFTPELADGGISLFDVAAQGLHHFLSGDSDWKASRIIQAQVAAPGQA